MRILMMATYPWEIPQHGGQHRIYNIERALVAAGHEIEKIGVLGSPAYPSATGFVPYPGDQLLTKYLPHPALMEDWAISRLFSQDDQYFHFLFDQVKTVPDLIFVEQPWLFEAAEKFSESKNNKIRIHYGSQNIEFQLKYELSNQWFGSAVAADYREKIYNVEMHAARNADTISNVAQSDVDWMRSNWGLQSILSKNGVAERPFAIEHAVESAKFSQGRKFALYCASAHPPNIDGFLHFFGEGVGCFSPNEMLIVAGGAGESIRNAPAFSRIAGLQDCYVNAGLVSEECLSGLLHTAHVIILPIAYGGGTNLKSSEAVWAGQHIVATPTAMRGLDEFHSAEGVTIAKNGREFRTAIRDAMLKPKLDISARERERRRSVLWEATLADLVQSINAMSSRP